MKKYDSHFALGRMGRIGKMGIALAISFSPALGSIVDCSPVTKLLGPLAPSSAYAQDYSGNYSKGLTGHSEINNSGKVEYTSNLSEVYGIFGKDDTNTSYTFHNFVNGSIKLNATPATPGTEAYGIYADSNEDGRNTLSNEGEINIKITGGTYGKGMYAESQKGGHELTNANTGKISIDTTGASGTVSGDFLVNTEIAGIEAMSYEGGHTISNEGDIKVKGEGGKAESNQITNGFINAHGILASVRYKKEIPGNGKGNHNISNNKLIDVSATGGTSTSTSTSTSLSPYHYSSASVEAYAIHASGAAKSSEEPGGHTLSNNREGIVKVIATGGSATGSKRALACAYAYGINVDNNGGASLSSGKHSLKNDGSINVTAQGGKAKSTIGSVTSHAIAEGMSVTGDGTLVYKPGSNGHQLVNDGSIIVEANGGTSDAKTDSDAYARAYGMSAYGKGGHTLSNEKSIEVTAIGGTATTENGKIVADAKAYGMYNKGNSGDYKTYNNGTIKVTAEASTDNAYAYGMQIGGTGSGSSYFVENTGTIETSATATNGTTRRYEVYGTGVSSNINYYSVGTWATTLRDWTDTNAVFAVHPMGSITFENSTFIVRPGTTDEGFKFGKAYKVADMAVAFEDPDSTAPSYDPSIPIVYSKATLEGTIAKVTTDVPLLKATLINGNTPSDATIRLDDNVTSQTTPSSATVLQSLHIVKGQMDRVERTLQSQNIMRLYKTMDRDGDDIALASNGNSFAITAPSNDYIANPWQAFLIPYASTLDNSRYNFDGNSVGAIGGVNYLFSNQFLAGMHFDIGFSDADADIMEMSSDINSYALGLHANYNIMPEWYVRAQFTGSFSESNNDYKMGETAPLYAGTDVDHTSFYTSLNTGYIWTVAKDETSIHSLTPQIGLSYLRMDTDGYDINWSDPAAGYDMSYDDSSFDALYANLNVQWRSQWVLRNGYDLALTSELGLRQNLTDDEFESNVNTLGSNYTTYASEDATTVTAGAGVELQKENYGFSLNYEGDYGDDQTVHTGKFLMKIMF